MQPGDDRPDHRAEHEGDQHTQDDLVILVEQPEAEGDQHEDERRPHDTPKCPSIGR